MTRALKTLSATATATAARNMRGFRAQPGALALQRQILVQSALAAKKDQKMTRAFSGGTAEKGSEEAAAGPLDFHDTKIAFNSKTTFELFRGWVVFQVCGIGPLVRHCDQLYSMSVKVLGSTITHFFMRHGLFNHFCAGENAKEIIPKMEHLRKYGVGGILDYAAEAKDEEPKAKKPVNEEEVIGAPLSAKTYEYAGESLCDANAEIFMDAIRAVKDATPDGFAAIKLSGLGDPQLLERMSTCLVEMAKLFHRVSNDPSTNYDVSTVPFYAMDRSFSIDWDTFKNNWPRLFTVQDEATLKAIFEDIDKDRDGSINYLEWSEGIRLSHINEMARSCINPGPLYHSALNEEEQRLYFNLCNRMERIMDLAEKEGVRVMVDAEWTAIQPAIDHLVLFLQRKYNRGETPIVFQTYQTYLKGMHDKVVRDLARSKKEGWSFGAKVVRGAYMVSEREKAAKKGVESPICDTYEETEENYHKTIDSILSHNVGATGNAVGKDTQGEILVASHNRDTMEFVTRRCTELSKDKSKGIYFGQLMGMADHLTFTLASHGFKAYKYVPYGPIDEVVPYLIRRTQENSAILGSPGVQEERSMVGQELRRRISPF
mmetsp:Transcript_83989/g.175691  ORF Transcript_83989/g.175691 Transcript_83989/m.175691 type:complete len:601 (-) Transcript_83989:495-2297(-)